MRFDVAGDAHHFVGDRHLKIHAGMNGVAQNPHVAVGDVTAIFTQVHGNAVCARLLRDKRGLYRIGIVCATCVTYGGDVIDVDP